MNIDVRAEGNVWTVFLDESGRPLPIADFKTPPIGGFPFTSNEVGIRSRYPGASFRLVSEVRPPQPEVATLSPEVMAQELLKLTGAKQEVEPPKRKAAAKPKAKRAPKKPILTHLKPLPLIDRGGPSPELLSAFEDFCADIENDEAAIVAVGTFLLNLGTISESAIKRASEDGMERRVQPKKRKFSL